jgi:tetratricopeptide (TPR) repeat protein
MRFAAIISALVFSLSSGILNAQVQIAPDRSKALLADSYRDESIVIELSETTYRMHADGTGERNLHAILRIQSDGAAQQFGVLSFSYASASETPVIKLVRVHKADGTTVDTPVADAIDMPAEVSREAPLYSDLKEKHLPVRSLSKGDTLEYEVDTTINKPEAPGQFWGVTHFTPPGNGIVLAEILTLEFPSDKYVQVWSPNHAPNITEHDGLRTYSWNVAQLIPAPKNKGEDSTKLAPPKDPDEDSEGRKIPSAAWTTFHSWTEVGDWYRSLALKQADPGDAIRARADDLTKDAKTPEEQVRALYNFVSTHTRYIGIDFGIGRYQPHTAAEVLADQYGDCKDKDTLLEALLHAKGFSTAPALIGAGIAPVPEVPSPAVFNHVITTINLPSGRIWLDSTPLASPYGFLVSIIRDQKALVVPATAPATLESTPANAPYPFTERFEATGSLDADGKITAKMTFTYHDDDEVVVRALARSVAPAEWDKISQYISANSGFGGATSDTQFKNDTDSSQPIVLTYEYTRHPYGDWDDRRIVPLFPALELPVLDADNTPPADDIQLGAPRTLGSISRIRLPEGYRTDLPDPIHVKTDFATFDKTYRFEGNEIVAERTIVILKNKVAKDDWKRYQTFTNDISLRGEAWIQLLPPSHDKAVAAAKQSPPTDTKEKKKSDETTVTVPVEHLPINPTTPANLNPPPSASPSELMNTARDKMQAGDWDGATQALDQVKAKNPNEENLWGSYGFIAQMQDHDLDVAEADYSKEIQSHPDNTWAVVALSTLQSNQSNATAAVQTLQHYLDRHPDNTRLAMYLATLQTNASDSAGALKTLEKAANENQDDRALRIQLSEALFRMNRMDEAAAAAKSALDGTDDPGLLNDAAYTLSETGLDLDIAESASRKSIEKQEEKTAAITTDQVNSTAFALSNTLIASWDTLGWIVFQEGKYDDAKPWLLAAWRASLNADVGDHLAQLYEAQHHEDDAAATYYLAQAALNKNTPPETRRHIAESIDRLHNQRPKPGTATETQALQSLRTYKVSRPAGTSGWGTFRLEITTSGVIESQQMSGEDRLAGIKPALTAMKFPDLLPPESKAHLLRSVVISCSIGTTCEVVLVPDGGLQTERQ